MKKLKVWAMKALVNKYAGVAVSTAVAYVASYLTAKVADAPAWLTDMILTAINTGAAEGGAAQITTLDEQSFTAVLTPIFTIAVQAGVNALQSAKIEKVQKANGEVVDGYLGDKTLKSATGG